ncbi:hypothetical protein HI914_02357 [Erysiphe necator]|nr:hypothetical protein HI914_02357 [Erysiphe necator]
MSTTSPSISRSYVYLHFPKSAKASLVLTSFHPWKLRQFYKSRISTRKYEKRFLATVNQEINYPLDFRASGPFKSTESGKNGPKYDERTVKLGKTLRTLQERLPTLLQKPLPSKLLSPRITLNLFPSTHPHLPSVTGRVAYSAALWTSPIAWGRLPLISNVRLEILSERMIKHSHLSCPSRSYRPEQLVVRWRTTSNSHEQNSTAFIYNSSLNDNVDKITEWLGGGNKNDDIGKDFTGLFIFEFDEEGRILTHTIEHAQEGGNWERGVGAKVVGLTDWLLGGMKGSGRGESAPCPAFCGDNSKQRYGPGKN